MADKAKVKAQLDLVVEKLLEIGPYTAEDWGGTILFKVTDLDTGWMMKMSMDGTVESLVEKVDEEAAISTIEMDSDTLVGIFDGTVNPTAAREQGKMSARGSLEGLLKVLLPVIA